MNSNTLLFHYVMLGGSSDTAFNKMRLAQTRRIFRGFNVFEGIFGGLFILMHDEGETVSV